MAEVRGAVTHSALNEGARICHSTGKDNLFHKDTGRPEKLCRGARDLQLAMFVAWRFLAEPTDECWDAKCKELGITPNAAS